MLWETERRERGELLAWHRVTEPSVEVAPLRQLWAQTCRTARVFSGRDGRQLITDFWQKRVSLVEMGCSSGTGFCTGQFCTACACYSTTLGESLAHGKDQFVFLSYPLSYFCPGWVNITEGNGFRGCRLAANNEKKLIIGKGRTVEFFHQKARLLCLFVLFIFAHNFFFKQSKEKEYNVNISKYLYKCIYIVFIYIYTFNQLFLYKVLSHKSQLVDN